MPALSQVPAMGGVKLWLVDLSCEPDGAGLAMLSADERLRALRFHFPRDRRRYLAAHVALRRLLAERIGSDPRDLRYETGAAGKPRLAGVRGCGFSLSYADDVALIGLSDRLDIGVDLEAVRRFSDRDELAALHFTPGERRELAETAGPGGDRCFLRGWTRKEACVKALGTGLATAPSSFETGLGSDGRIVLVPLSDAAAEVELRTVEVGEGLVAACACLLGVRLNRRSGAAAPSLPSEA